MTAPTVADVGIESMLRERGGATVPSELHNAIVAAVRAESARARTLKRRWLAGPGLRPALAFAVAGLLFAVGLAAMFVGSQNATPRPTSLPSSAPSSSPATSAGGGGLILFGSDVPIGDGSGGVIHCRTFHTMRPDGSDERQLPLDCMLDGGASWGPCTSRGGDCGPTGDAIIFYGSPLSGSTTEIDEFTIDGDGPGALLTLSDGVDPVFSPDGSRIAYVGTGSAPRSDGIFIADSDGTHPRQLTSVADPANDWDMGPSFSPDGSRLVFTREMGANDPDRGTMEIWMVNSDGTDLHPLTSELSESEFARWSPDGSHLLFTGRQTASAGSGLWTIDPDGTSMTRVIPDTGELAADWSPDGSRIVDDHFHSGISSLRVMNADGSSITDLLSSSPGQPSQYGSLDWGLPNTLQPEVP